MISIIYQRFVYILAGVFVFIIVLAFVSPIYAVDVLPNEVCQSKAEGGQVVTACKDDSSASGAVNPILGKDGVVTKGIQIFALIIGVAATVMIFISAYQFMTAQGDPKSASNARNTLIYAIVGLILAFSAQVIVSFILSKV